MRTSIKANRSIELKSKERLKLTERFKAATQMTTTEDIRNRFINEEGYDPVYMYKALSKTPVPTQKEWLMRVKKADQFIEKVTNAPFLDKFRIEI